MKCWMNTNYVHTGREKCLRASCFECLISNTIYLYFFAKVFTLMRRTPNLRSIDNTNPDSPTILEVFTNCVLRHLPVFYLTHPIIALNLYHPSNRPRVTRLSLPEHKCPTTRLINVNTKLLHLHLSLPPPTKTMKPRILALLLLATSVAAGPLPHVFAHNYTQHMQLLDAYPIDHPIWMTRMGERDLKVRVGLNDL